MQTIHVIKIGGALINNNPILLSLLKDLAKIKAPFVLVHGGGRQVDEWLEKLGLKPNMVDGRRITDKYTLDLAVMNYAGLLNKRIVAQLQAAGRNALGLTGADMNSITAHQRVHPDIDFGYVGDIDSVDGEVFYSLCQNGITPVCCAITHDMQGQLLNTNADTIACEVAIALAKKSSTQLWYAFEKPGVLRDVEDPNSAIGTLTAELYAEMLENGSIHTGMKPKLHNCFKALESGVDSVNICHANGLRSIPNSSGTQVTLS